MSERVIVLGPIEFEDCEMCVDLTKKLCFGCRHLAQLRIRTLAHNLAIAAGLAAAFMLGEEWGAWNEDPYPDAAPWHAGGNRPAPGWGGR